MTAPLRLLFVCVENACRSQIAEAFARAAGQQAYSAGSSPSGRVHPRALATMAELGLELTGQRSTSLAELPAGLAFDAAVTMGCGDACPHVAAAHREDWDIPDPKDLDDEGFRRVRTRIGQEVAGLIARLGSTAAEP